MIWLVWRRQRAALLVAVGVAVGLAVVLVVGRFQAFAVAGELGVTACLRPGSTVCETPPWGVFRREFSAFHDLVRIALMGLPVVTGVLAGAGLFGRELEQGTHVVALTQAVGRGRWFGLGLLVCGLPVAVVAAVTAPLAAWALEPFQQLAAFGPLTTPTFETTGLVPVGYTLLAFCVAAAAGLVLRNALVAVVVAFAFQLAVQLALTFALRDQYLPPVEARFDLAAPGVTIPDGKPLAFGYVDGSGREVRRTGGCPPRVDYPECLRASGVTGQFVRYQPDSRYWPFQGIEVAITLVLAAGAVGAGVRALRSRVH